MEIENLEQATTQAKQEYLTAKTATYDLGAILCVVKDKKLFRPKHRSFEAYMKADLAEIDRSWAYDAMAVARDFPREPAQEHGISTLLEVRHLQREAFKSMRPADLLVGEHRFIDADGVEHVFNFAETHSVDGIKALTALVRERRDGPQEPSSPEVQGLADALKAATALVPTAHFHLNEQPKEIQVELHGPAGDVRTLIRRISEALG